MLRPLRLSVLLLFLSGMFTLAVGQEGPSAGDSVIVRMTRQLLVYPQEKLHLQTDKLAYLSGERIWLRAHLVRAESHIPAPLSRYVHIELFNPFDELVHRILIRPDSLGVHAGYLDLEETLPEGDYTLRAYTRYMLDRGEETLFRKTVRVRDPYSLQVETMPAFSFSERNVNLKLQFRDRISGEGVQPEIVTVTLPGKGVTRLKGRDGVYEARLPRGSAGGSLLLGLSRDGRKYQRYLSIPWPEDEFDVALLPEGGYLVPGRTCRVGVKALRPDGLGETVSGIVYDQQGTEVIRFGPFSKGMGYFQIKPAQGAAYHAVCTVGDGVSRRFDLPAAEASARVLQLIPAGPSLIISLLRGEEAPGDPLSLLIHSNGVPLLHVPWDPDRLSYSCPLASLPGGVIDFVLLNGNLDILSERLYFHVSPDMWVRPEARLSVPSYTTRDRVSLSFLWPDQVPDSLAVLGISVVDSSAAFPDRAGSLAATLLLETELRGPIEEPASYFAEGKDKDREALMLTQGWRRYDLPGVLKGRLESPASEPERDVTISGKADAMLFSSMDGGRIALYATQDSLSACDMTLPDKDGRFRFHTEFPEGTEVTLEGQTRKGGKGNILSVDPTPWPSTREASLPNRSEAVPVSAEDSFMRQADEAYYLAHGDRSTLLDAAVISADREEVDIQSEWYSPITSSRPLTAAEIEQRHFTSILSVYLSTSGLAIRHGQNGNYLTTTRSDQPVLPVIDDVVLPEFDLMLLEPNDIDNLFVIKDNTSMFGYYPGFTGAVVITTTVGSLESKKNSNIDRILPPGYQRPASFYAPKYDTPEARETGLADLRTTLYWNPSMRFSRQGELQVEFYSADRPTTYLLTGEGVTEEGRLVRLEARIPVR